MATAGRDDRPVEHFDKRPGGSYRLVLTYADASAARGTSAADSDVVDARFVEIVPEEGVTAASREEQKRCADSVALPQRAKGAAADGITRKQRGNDALLTPRFAVASGLDSSPGAA